MRFPAVLAVAVLAALLGACGDDGGPPPGPDGGMGAVDAGAPGPEPLPSGALLAPPEAPGDAAPPVLGPCPDGWRSVESARAGGAAVCEPWPEPGPATCADEQAHFPGEPGCRVVGAACPAGAWPDDLPATAVLYVEAGASSGDGSRAAPFGRIADAVPMAGPGTTVAVAAGDYDEAVVLPDGVTLRGVCPSRTRLAYSVRDDAPATVTVQGTDVVVRDLSIGGARSGLLVDGGAVATVEGVIVDSATETGLRVHRTGQGTLREIIIRDTITDPGDGLSAFGLVVEFGGVAEASHLLVERNGVANVVIDSEGSSLLLTDSLVREARVSDGDGVYGAGLGTQHGARTELRRVVVEDNHYGGVTAQGGAEVTAFDLVVRRTTPDSSGSPAAGLAAIEGGLMRLERVLSEENVGAAFLGSNMAGELHVTDAVFRDSVEVPEGYPGAVGLVLQGEGSVLAAERVSVEGMTYAGLVLGGAGTTGSASALRVLGVDGGRGGEGGAGFVVQNGAVITASGVLVEGAHLAGLLVSGAEARLDVSDLTVRQTGPQPSDGEQGRGVQVQEPALLVITRALVEHNLGAGLSAVQAGRLVARDVRVGPTGPAVAGLYEGFGVGLFVTERCDLELERVHVDRSTGFGAIFSTESTVRATDLRISRTADLGVEVLESRFGRGLDVQRGSDVEITRAIFEANRDTAIHVGRGALDTEPTRLTLRDAIVRDQSSAAPGLLWGHGLIARGGGEAFLEQVRFERNREVSVAAWDEGSRVEMSDVEILDTLTNECALDTCRNEGGGIGVGAYLGASVSADRFLVTRSALAGLQVGETGELDLTSGEVSHGLIGANIQNPDFDVSRITGDVVYLENGVNLDSTVLPVPRPGAQFDAEGG